MIYRRRLLEPAVRDALARFRVVALVGARQVGKSTLAWAFPERHLVTLDDLGALAAAASDPQGFVEGLPLPATIDEIQRVPQLLLAIKQRVDRERQPGAFLVTGSSRLETLRGIRESLAGRVALLTLRPMTYLEIEGAIGASPVERLFECRDLPSAVARYAPLAAARGPGGADFLAGGFPEPALHLDEAGRRSWFRQYARSYIERDLPAVLRIEETPAFLRFVTACAATTARLLNTTEMARDVGVSVDTARRWIGVLEATFLAERRAPFWRNVRTRLVKSPKLFLADSGLAASLLGVQDWRGALEDGLAGQLLETWVHAQIEALAEVADPQVELLFYRTHGQVEVDFVLVRRRRMVPVEVKLGATVGPRDARGIEAVVGQFPRECPFGIVLYCGRSVLPLTEHAAAVPLAAFLAG